MYELNYQQGKLQLAFETTQKTKKYYEFAYYIYQDGQVIDRVWYETFKRQGKLTFKPIYSGSYQVRLFVRENGTVVFNQLSNVLWIDVLHKKQIETTLAAEKVFFSDHPVKYLFQAGNHDARHLVLSFSGLYSTEFQGGPPVYNHMRTLEPVLTHKLFILDSFQNQFCYYVGFGGEQEFERSVVALITTIANKYQIPAENIIATGSSKGGAAALYYSFKYHFGKAVIGAPQVYIAKYLEQRATSESMQERFNRFLGADPVFGKRFWNGLILNQALKVQSFPELHFHVGKGDFHYPEHLKPLLKKLDEKAVPYTLDIGQYEKHSDTGIYFTPFLLKKVQEIVMRKEEKN